MGLGGVKCPIYKWDRVPFANGRVPFTNGSCTQTGGNTTAPKKRDVPISPNNGTRFLARCWREDSWMNLDE